LAVYLKGTGVKANVSITFVVSMLAAAFFAGCGIEEPLERVAKEPKPYTNRLPDAYKNMELKQTTSAEVLENIKLHKKELISQSESVVACWDEKKKTYQFWVTMAAFDEEDSTVARKYFLAVDEKPWHLHNEGQKMRFDCQMILDEKTLAEPYASENEKRIAIVKKMLDITRDDFLEVRKDSKVVDTGAMMTNQTIERILYVLSQSPQLATRLVEEGGMDFDHSTLDAGRVRLILCKNVAILKIRIGSVKRLWKME
jgi:hypothetical protein